MHGGTLRTLRIALRQEVLRQREWSIVSRGTGEDLHLFTKEGARPRNTHTNKKRNPRYIS